MPVSGETGQGEYPAQRTGPVAPGELPRAGKSGGGGLHRTKPCRMARAAVVTASVQGLARCCRAEAKSIPPSSCSGEKTTEISVQHFI